MKSRYYKAFVMLTTFTIFLFSLTGCFYQVKNIDVDGINVAFVNYFISDEEVEKRIAPIVRTVKNNMGDYLAIADVRMNTPVINFKLNFQQIESKRDFGLALGELRNIHDKVDEFVLTHVDYYTGSQGWRFELFYDNDTPLLETLSYANVENEHFGETKFIYVYSSKVLEYINNLNGDYEYFYNKTGEAIPKDYCNYFSNLHSLKTYINAEEDLQCISKLSNLKYADLIIKNNVDLSCLADCKSIENLDLYLLKNIELSLFPELNNLKILFIHSTNISNEDIQILKDKLPDCNVSLSDDMNVY